MVITKHFLKKYVGFRINKIIFCNKHYKIFNDIIDQLGFERFLNLKELNIT
jgi:hypothetical protein